MVSPLMPEPEKEWGGLCAALGCELLLSGGRHDAVINVVRLQAGISALWGPARLSAQCFLRMDYLQLMFNSSNERAPQPGKRSAGAAEERRRLGRSRCAFLHRSQPRIHQLLVPLLLALLLYPAERCLLSPGSKLLLAHVLAVFFLPWLCTPRFAPSLPQKSRAGSPCCCPRKMGRHSFTKRWLAQRGLADGCVRLGWVRWAHRASGTTQLVPPGLRIRDNCSWAVFLLTLLKCRT